MTHRPRAGGRRPPVPPRNTPPHPPATDGEPRRLLRIAGLAAVSALFARDPERVERLFFDERLKGAAGDFCRHMAARRRPYRMVDGEELAKVAGTVLHGGIVAVTAPRPVPALDAADAPRWAAAHEPLLLLDGVGNPHNLGAIVRTAAFFGLPRLAVSDHPAQALPSEAAYRVAEGGFEWLELWRAERLAATLKRLKPAYRIIGTALDPRRPTVGVEALAHPGPPVALILGNEEDGLPRATLDACDAVLTIPGGGRVQSLNVAATAAILIHALAAGRPASS